MKIKQSKAYRPGLAQVVWGCLASLAIPPACVAQGVGGYQGPSILSRGGNSPGQRGRAPIDFQFYGSVRGAAETGLIPAAVDEQGDLQDVTLYGVQAELGLYGGHTWKRSSLGVDYRGDYRQYTRNTSFNGTNQVGSLVFGHQLSRRTTVSVQQSLGTINRAFGGFVAPAVTDLNNPGIPLNEIFDERAYFLQTAGQVAHRMSARTTVAVSGSGFAIKRSAASLAGVRGYQASGQASYRVTRRDTILGVYNWTEYSYPRRFGGAKIHTVSGGFSREVSEALTVSLTAGVFRAGIQGAQIVTLAPEIAAILGRTTGVEAFDSVVYKPSVDAQVTYSMERGRFNAAFSSGPSPGNGLYLTSNTQSVSSGYSYTGIRKLSLGVSVNRTRMSSLAQDIQGDLTYLQGGGGFSYNLGHNLALTTQLDGRRFRSPGIQGRSGLIFSMGLSYSPASIPLSIW